MTENNLHLAHAFQGVSGQFFFKLGNHPTLIHGLLQHAEGLWYIHMMSYSTCNSVFPLLHLSFTFHPKKH